MGMKTRSADEWRAIIAEQEASGQRQAEWCKERGINFYTYRDRASRLRKTEKDKDAANSAWVEIKPESVQAGGDGTGKPQLSAVPGSPNENAGAEPALAHKAGRLVIKIGGVRLCADAAYPAEKLSALVRGLAGA